MVIENKSLSVRQVCERLGVNATKVGLWIRSGELRALNVALHPGNKSRWRILPADLAAFEAARSAQPRAVPTTPRRRRADPGVTQFF